MACLQKTFEGTNLPALVNKIMKVCFVLLDLCNFSVPDDVFHSFLKGQFAPVKGNYTPHFKKLVRDLLQRDPEFRPTTSELMLSRLPEVIISFFFFFFCSLN